MPTRATAADVMHIVAAVLMALVVTETTTAFASQGWGDCSGQMIDPKFDVHIPPGSVKICREGVLAIAYDAQMLNPAISLYYIDAQHRARTIPGRDNYYADPDLKAMNIPQAPVKSKTFNQTWNRGHLAPNSIMSYSKEGKKACFSMANMAPQWGYFNQQPWQKMEAKLADFIMKSNRGFYMVTGVAYKNRATTPRGPDNIAFPTWYIHAICDPISGNAAGFYGLNDPSMTANVEYVPVATIERMYGGKLFPRGKCNVDTVNREFWLPVESQTRPPSYTTNPYKPIPKKNPHQYQPNPPATTTPPPSTESTSKLRSFWEIILGVLFKVVFLPWI